LPPPKRAEVKVPAGRPNLARSAKVKFLRPGSWVGEDYTPVREVSVNDGKKEAPPGGWFARKTLELAAFVPSPPAWELEWKEPVTLNAVTVHESADHPEAVPEEVLIEAWVGGAWKVVAHELWNTGTTHVHVFDAVTTTRLRYTPVGDLAKNVWLAEIEVFHVLRKKSAVGPRRGTTRRGRSNPRELRPCQPDRQTRSSGSSASWWSRRALLSYPIGNWWNDSAPAATKLPSRPW
jgi:hypothetical protein